MTELLTQEQQWKDDYIAQHPEHADYDFLVYMPQTIYTAGRDTVVDCMFLSEDINKLFTVPIPMDQFVIFNPNIPERLPLKAFLRRPGALLQLWWTVHNARQYRIYGSLMSKYVGYFPSNPIIFIFRFEDTTFTPQHLQDIEADQLTIQQALPQFTLSQDPVERSWIITGEKDQISRKLHNREGINALNQRRIGGWHMNNPRHKKNVNVCSSSPIWPKFVTNARDQQGFQDKLYQAVQDGKGDFTLISSTGKRFSFDSLSLQVCFKYFEALMSNGFKERDQRAVQTEYSDELLEVFQRLHYHQKSYSFIEKQPILILELYEFLEFHQCVDEDIVLRLNEPFGTLFEDLPESEAMITHVVENTSFWIEMNSVALELLTVYRNVIYPRCDPLIEARLSKLSNSLCSGN
jgi:hypothetical protein